MIDLFLLLSHLFVFSHSYTGKNPYDRWIGRTPFRVETLKHTAITPSVHQLSLCLENSSSRDQSFFAFTIDYEPYFTLL